MNLSKQIKYFRKRDNLSQENLAEKIYVSRQSISNWENERSYPDIHNLLMMSVLFNVSLDELVKGDVTIMKNKIQQSDLAKWGGIMTALSIIVPLSIAPALYFFGNYGLLITVICFIALMSVSIKVENIKKEYHLKTYKNILDFMEGKTVEATKSNKKDLLVKIGIVSASALIGFILVYISMSLLGL